ncbi:MAG TPA: glutathione S-transferase [Wenzhouxiangella sp.]
MIELHYLAHSRSQRILWFAEEIGLEYQLIIHERDPVTRLAKSEVKALHPLGKLPLLVDGELTLAESAIILEYMARHHAPDWLIDSADSDYWNFQYWMHYAEASIMPPLLIRLIFSMLKGPAVPALIRPLSKRIANQVDQTFTNPQIATHFDFVEAYLGQNEWFVGDRITIADVQMLFPLEAALAKGSVQAQAFPNIVSYVNRLQGRPAYQRALSKGGPYEFGPV